MALLYMCFKKFCNDKDDDVVPGNRPVAAPAGGADKSTAPATETQTAAMPMTAAAPTDGTNPNLQSSAPTGVDSTTPAATGTTTTTT